MHGSDADGDRDRRLWLSSRALVFEQRVELDLWLSATCAVVSTASDGLTLLDRASDIRSDLFLTKMGTAVQTLRSGIGGQQVPSCSVAYPFPTDLNRIEAEK
jgi:hypothetical protein